MLKKVLIANRGEIAVRIIRACREMNIDTVAVYSEEDRGALFTILATEAICIGPARASESYLNMESVLTAAIKTGCDSIHPGFGFLSENPEFARKVKECGLKFIGPEAEVIEQLGNKSAARELMQKYNVPVVPGSDGIVETAEKAAEIAAKLGYPVLIKASSGGGGKGMRLAHSADEIKEAYETAKAEALANFSDDDVYIEKLIVNPRHIEVQILADEFGNVIHLGERECSIQRRNQKLIEESPSKAINEEQRKKMGEAAVNAAKVAGYTNAGTVEFVLSQDGSFYFIEMNTRIQVEHPVTEMVTGIDIVREQLRIASGMKLKYAQEDVHMNGHAIECRLIAEDPENNFMPCPGKISYLHIPGGFDVRVDTALYSGCTISPFYDSMIAKIIVHGSTRNEAVLRMRRVLEEFIAQGVKTNLGLLYMILYNPDFIKAKYNTSFIEDKLEELLRPLEKDRTL